jgi:hypothetical protein
MATNAHRNAPGWLRIAALIAIVWNLFGVFMYLHSVGVFGDPMADLDAAQRAAAESLPPAITAAFAIGTFAGLIGSVGLLLRKSWAWPVLFVSMIALIALETWILFLSGHREAFGIGVPITVASGAILLAWLAHHARQRGWLV